MDIAIPFLSILWQLNLIVLPDKYQNSKQNTNTICQLTYILVQLLFIALSCWVHVFRLYNGMSGNHKFKSLFLAKYTLFFIDVALTIAILIVTINIEDLMFKIVMLFWFMGPVANFYSNSVLDLYFYKFYNNKLNRSSKPYPSNNALCVHIIKQPQSTAMYLLSLLSLLASCYAVSFFPFFIPLLILNMLLNYIHYPAILCLYFTNG